MRKREGNKSDLELTSMIGLVEKFIKLIIITIYQMSRELGETLSILNRFTKDIKVSFKIIEIKTTMPDVKILQSRTDTGKEGVNILEDIHIETIQ